MSKKRFSLDGPKAAYQLNWWCSESPATFQIEMKIDCIHQQILLSRDVTKVQLLDSFLSPKWNKWCSESPTTFESGMKIYHIFYCHYHQFHQRHNFLSWIWQGLWRLCDSSIFVHIIISIPIITITITKNASITTTIITKMPTCMWKSIPSSLVLTMSPQ